MNIVKVLFDLYKCYKSFQLLYWIVVKYSQVLRGSLWLMIVRTDIVGWFPGQGNHSDIFTAQPCRMRNPTEICARSFSFHFKQSNNRNCNRSCVTHINWKWKKDCEEMPHIDPGSYFGNHVGRIDGMGQGSGMLTWQKKLSQCIYMFHFQTSKFDYEEDFTGPEMLLTEVKLLLL